MTEYIKNIENITFQDYGSKAESFWENTKDHDVSQNYEAFLTPFNGRQGLDILDFGCGPGRDIAYFKSLGHHPVGLDGTLEFCEMAREKTDCPVLHQSFNDLDLTENSFDGIFANASIFHVPSQNLPKVLSDLYTALRDGGIFFMSNPRGNNEGWATPTRYGNFMQFDQTEKFLMDAGFKVLHHYFRPPNLPPEEQRWLAVVSQTKK